MRALAGLTFLFCISWSAWAADACPVDPGCVRILERAVNQYGLGSWAKLDPASTRSVALGITGVRYVNIEKVTVFGDKGVPVEKVHLALQHSAHCDELEALSVGRYRNTFQNAWVATEEFRVEFHGVNCTAPRLLNDETQFVSVEQCRFDDPVSPEFHRRMCEIALGITPRPRPVPAAPAPSKPQEHCDAWTYLGESSGKPLPPEDEKFLRNLAKSLNDASPGVRGQALDRLVPGAKSASTLLSVILNDPRPEVRLQALGRLSKLISHNHDPDAIRAYRTLEPSRIAHLGLPLARQWISGLWDLPIDLARGPVKLALLDKDLSKDGDFHGIALSLQIAFYRSSGSFVDWAEIEKTYRTLTDPGDRGQVLMSVASLYTNKKITATTRDQMRPFLEKVAEDPDPLVAYWAKEALHPTVVPPSKVRTP